AEEDDEILRECPMDLVELPVRDRGQIDVADLGADDGRQLLDRDRLIRGFFRYKVADAWAVLGVQHDVLFRPFSAALMMRYVDQAPRPGFHIIDMEAVHVAAIEMEADAGFSGPGHAGHVDMVGVRHKARDRARIEQDNAAPLEADA